MKNKVAIFLIQGIEAKTAIIEIQKHEILALKSALSKKDEFLFSQEKANEKLSSMFLDLQNATEQMKEKIKKRLFSSPEGQKNDTLGEMIQDLNEILSNTVTDDDLLF